MEKPQPRSVKEALQRMMPSGDGVIRGVVLSNPPLKIQAVNDEKLTIDEDTACVPRHLTDYTTKVDIQLDGGSIDSQTYNDGEHSQPDAGYGGAHVNHLQTFNIFGATMKVYNALKPGDKVFLLSYNGGKKYYVLDREEE